ncbi:MAG: phosphatase PAP2 family protein [Tannerella sp.]|jgi:membrane-associated phospholipid phosphatase|nr:phosphatase PAP2 family protein [Tannerella sp.]
MRSFLLILLYGLITESIEAKYNSFMDAESSDIIQRHCEGETGNNLTKLLNPDDFFAFNSARQPPRYDRKRLTEYPASGLIIPSVFMAYGALAQVINPLQRLDHDTDKEVTRHYVHRPIDNYLMFAPVAFVYGLDWVGVKAKHNFRDRTFVVITSHLLMAGIVHSVKTMTKVRRPDGSGFRSFPSGHTASAFTGAHILMKEYKDISPWIGVAGYATATAVGTLRILNRRHWISDVVAGAGVGIFSAEIAYMLLPVFHRMIGVNPSKSGVVFAPVVGNNGYGLGLACVF